MVVLVLHCRSLLTISLVTSTSASIKLLCSKKPVPNMSSPLIVDLFFAKRLAFMAAILSSGMASDNDDNL